MLHPALLAALVGCGGPLEVRELSTEVLEEPSMVVRVTWTTDHVATGVVEFGESESYGHATPSTAPGTHHEVLLLGLPPSTDAHLRVVAQDGAHTVETDDLVVTTGGLPSGFPVLEASGTTVDGYSCLTVLGKFNGEVIVDRHGRVVWYHANAAAQKYRNTRCYLSADGQAVVFNGEPSGEGFFAHGQLVRAPLDGSEPVVVEGVDTLSHDFAQLPDGTLAAIVQETRDIEGRTVYGDAIYEIGLDGGVVEVWSVFDHFDPRVDGHVADNGNWLHANAIDYDPDADAYDVGLLELHAIARVDRWTGDLEWLMGGERSDFALAGGAEGWGIIHQFDLSGDEVLVFVNAGDDSGAASRVHRYAVDWGAWSLTETSRYVGDTHVYALGDATRIDDEVVGITWSTSGLIEHVRGAERSWSLQTDFGNVFGYTSFTPSLYVE